VKNKILNKLRNCLVIEDVLSLKKIIEESGFKICNTVSRKLILCRIKDGRVCTDNIYEDYIPLCTSSGEPVSDRMIKVLSKFISENYNPKEKLINKENNTAILYGNTIKLVDLSNTIKYLNEKSDIDAISRSV
jgi:hypothetical protein